jgi:hypothetical protein
MIPWQFALILALQNLVVAMAAGGALGAVTAWLLRLKWNWRILVRDVLTAGAAAFLLVLLTVLYDRWQHSVHDHSMVFVAAGSAMPAAARVLTFAARRCRSH